MFLPGESHGQGSLVGYSPRGRKELDMTETKHCTTRLGVLKSEMVWGRERACGQSTKSFCLCYSTICCLKSVFISFIALFIIYLLFSLVAQRVKCLAYNAGDLSSIPGLGRSSGEGNGNPLYYSCLENPMDGGDW